MTLYYVQSSWSHLGRGESAEHIVFAMNAEAATEMVLTLLKKYGSDRWEVDSVREIEMKDGIYCIGYRNLSWNI